MKHTQLITTALDLEFDTIDDHFDTTGPLPSRFDYKVDVPKDTCKGLSLVSEPNRKSKPYIPWDRIDKSPENIKRIDALILEVIADFVAKNKKGQ